MHAITSLDLARRRRCLLQVDFPPRRVLGMTRRHEGTEKEATNLEQKEDQKANQSDEQRLAEGLRGAECPYLLLKVRQGDVKGARSNFGAIVLEDGDIDRRCCMPGSFDREGNI